MTVSSDSNSTRRCPVDPDRVGGIVLAGGKSTRMGRSKADLPFGDELMLQRVVRILSEVVRPIVVVGAPQQELPPVPRAIEIVRDRISDRGPLQGLAAGLRALVGKCDAAYVCSCDVPLLKVAFVKRMIELLGRQQITVPYVGSFHHPLAAVYRLDVIEQVNDLLAADRRRPVFLFESADTYIVSQAELIQVDSKLDSLRNCNCPEDYEQALADWKNP